MKGVQDSGRRYYQDNLMIIRKGKENMMSEANSYNVTFIDLDPREDYLEENLYQYRI